MLAVSRAPQELSSIFAFFVQVFLLFINALGVASAQNIDMRKAKKVEQGQYHYFIVPESEWIQPRDIPSGGKAATDGLAIQYLLLDRQENAGDTIQRYFHVAKQAVTMEGLESLSKLLMSYNPAYETLYLHSIKVYRKGKMLDKLQSADISLIQQEKEIDLLLYNGSVTALAILSDIRIGDILEYSYTIVGSNPVFGDKYFGFFGIAWNAPVAEVDIRIVARQDKKLQYKAINSDIKPTIRVLDGNKEYRWHTKGPNVIRDEGEYPLWFDPYPWIQVSEYKSWEDVQTWASAIYRSQSALAMTDSLKKLVRAWTSKYAGDIERASAALYYVQNEIRYFGVEFGSNSHMPSKPEEVLSRRYGDCKDKSLLLATLLNAMGMEAYPALVSSRYGKAVSNWLPSPSAFDHVIVKTRINDQDYWVDPTLAPQESPIDVLSTPKYGVSLVVGSNTVDLESIVPGDNLFPQMDVEEKFVVDSKYDIVELIVKSIYKGQLAEAQRRRLKNQERTETLRSYLNYYERLYSNVEPSGDVDIIDNTAQNELTQIERYKIRNYFEESESHLRFNIYGYSLNPYVDLPQVVKRKMPLYVFYPVEINHRVRIEFPQEVHMNVGQSKEVLSDKSIKYQRNLQFEKGVLAVDFNYVSKRDFVPAADVKSHVATLKDITSSLSLKGNIKNYKHINEKKRNTDRLVDELLQRISQ